MILAAAAAICLAYPDMVGLLGDKYQEHETVVSLAEQGSAIVTFVSATSTWTMVIVYTDKTACVLATGTDFQMVLQ